MPMVYCWTVLSGDTSALPVRLGTSGTRTQAMAEAEEHMIRDQGLVCSVEAVRPSIASHSLSPCYERIGISWIGRRTRNDTVLWVTMPSATPPEPMRDDGGMRLRIFTEPQQGASYATLRRVALAAEELGFDGFFRSDHYLKMGDVPGTPGPTDAWTTLAALATETSRIRLGTLMTSATFRQPGALAITVAQVDEMSGGRVELGLGAGWYESEHKAYGIPFPPVAERFDRFAEQLAVVTGLWETPAGETFSFDGEYYQVTNSPGLPKPAQRPRPPIIIGGVGRRRTPALAALYADEFNVPFRTAAESAVIYDRVREACVQIGRDPATMIYSAAQVVCCGRDEAELTRRAAAIGRDLSELRRNGLAGTPDEIFAKIAEFARVGATCLYLQILDLNDIEHLELIASIVGAAASAASAASAAGASSAAGAAGASSAPSADGSTHPDAPASSVTVYLVAPVLASSEISRYFGRHRRGVAWGRCRAGQSGRSGRARRSANPTDRARRPQSPQPMSVRVRSRNRAGAA